MKNKLINIIFLMLLLFPMYVNVLKAEEVEGNTTNLEDQTSSDNTNSEEDLDEINEELEEKNEQLEKEKEITDKAKKQLEENQDEIEQLQEDLVQANKDYEKLQDNLSVLSDKAVKILKILQKSSNENTIIILYNQLIDSDSLGDFIIKFRTMNLFLEEISKLINELIEQLKILNEKKIEINEQSEHLEKVSKNLEEEITKYSENIEVQVNSLESISSQYFLSKCQKGEVYGDDCGTKLKEEEEFQFPITRGSVTNEYGGWDALEQSDGHTGIDMIGDEQIHPIAAGEVEEVTVDAYGGIQVMMIHNVKGINYITNYAHLSKVNVVPGDVLTTDDVLGIMGQTGVATGVHLHLEIIKGPYYIHSRLENPRDYLDFPPLYIEFTKKEEEDE